MAERPPDEPRDSAEEETVIDPDWGPESEVFVEQTETVPPRRRMPVIWPWLLALLLLVLGGLGAYWFFSQGDDDAAATTAAASTTQPPATTEKATTQAPARISVPDVVGTTSSEATAALSEAGLTADLVAVPSDKPAGTVVAQSPVAGKEVEKGSTVRVNVAQPKTTTTAPPAATTAPPATTSPPRTATVPDVVGKELADAAQAFADAGLKVAVQYVPSDEAQRRVIAQAQPAGTQRKRGETVQVNVSVGAQPAADTAVPDVVGQRQQQSRRALEQAGFEVLALSLNGQVRNESPIASQTPAGGASIPRGSLVILYVGAQ